MARKPKRPSRVSDSYTMLDELTASNTLPMPASDLESRVSVARANFAALQSPDTATVTAWTVVCMVGNVMETLVVKGLAADPDNLLGSAQDALRRATDAYNAGRGVIVLDQPEDVRALRWLLDDWEACMRGLSARSMIHCFRVTDRRIREIEAGRTQAHDFTIRHPAPAQATAPQ